MREFWNIIIDLQEVREEGIIQKLIKDPEYQAAQKKVDTLLESLDKDTALELDSAILEEEAIYRNEIYLAGLRDGFKLSKILNKDETMLQLFREKELMIGGNRQWLSGEATAKGA